MECHRCPHRKDVESGKYRRAPFRDTPCAGCELEDGLRYVIEYDDTRAGSGGSGGVPFPGEREEEDQLPLSVMADAVAALLSLRPHIRDVVCWRYAGMKYRDIAVLQGVTVAAVELRHRRALKKWPALKDLFAEKAAKQKRRQPHGGSGCGSRAKARRNSGAKRR